MNILSHTPEAILAMVLAEAGATMNISAHEARCTWLSHSPVRASKPSTLTGFLERTDKVRGVMKSRAEGVITTLTCAPSFTSKRTSKADLYAAMLPVMPRRMCFPLNIRLLYVIRRYVFILSRITYNGYDYSP